jgi:hypothetical protein
MDLVFLVKRPQGVEKRPGKSCELLRVRFFARSRVPFRFPRVNGQGSPRILPRGRAEGGRAAPSKRVSR